jgi:hypothetical protein
LHDTFLDHRKVRRMSKDTGLPSVHVRGHLVTLWLSVLRHAADGVLADWTSEDIADYAEWTGDPEQFVAALIRCGWLVERHEHLEVNDWAQYAEHLKAAKRKTAERERKALERYEEKRRKTATADEVRPALSENVRGQIRTEPDFRAERNRTEQNRTDLDRNRTEQIGTDLKPTPLSTSPQRVEPDLVLVPANDPEPDPAETKRADEVRAVYEHYREYHPRAHPKPTSKADEWTRIRARLTEGYSVDDLKLAIDGIHRSPFHSGENDRGEKYQDLKLAMRDSDQVAKLIAIAEQHANGPPAVLSEKTQRGIRAGLSWADRGSA